MALWADGGVGVWSFGRRDWCKCLGGPCRTIPNPLSAVPVARGNKLWSCVMEVSRRLLEPNETWDFREGEHGRREGHFRVLDFGILISPSPATTDGG